ncbi:MAG: hypothetical protein ABSE20_22155 [Acetobacteraceae bacterium]|jgi:hypothetical protein
MHPEVPRAKQFFAALEAAGMPEVPGEFSVVPRHQVIPAAALREIDRFIHVFDHVTTREAWQAAAQREAPAIAQPRRPEICFFSAWDFHLPPDGGCQLIEFNDNGSGFLFAAIINDLYYQAARHRDARSIAAPVDFLTFTHNIGNMVEQEAKAFFGVCPSGLFLILDDAESLRSGWFRRELGLLCELFRRKGWQAELGCPAETSWNGQHLLFHGQPVAFIVNRSTDFFWQSEDFSAVRRAYNSDSVYIAPDPFTYATRSDKRLLEWLSLPHWDAELGIQLEERQVLSAHTPETHVVRAENLDMLAQRKHDFVFKPLHGFAGRGLLDTASVGRARLRHLVKHREGYVAQKRVPKPAMEVEGQRLWADLRVWAWRGKIFNVSGRASRRPDRLDLTPPGGWLPTCVSG